MKAILFIPARMNAPIRHPYLTLRALCRAAFIIFMVGGTPAHATSVIEVTLEEMLQNSALVFEGRVIDIRVQENSERVIYTRVTFEVDDVIKGNVNGSKLTLDFLGGELAGRRLSVSEMQLPALHEQGIYFVESPGRRQMNPLYGWSQGHLTVKQDHAGTERVFTRSGRPVRGVERTRGKRNGALSNGVARGLIQGEYNSDDASALDKKAFKHMLREMQ